MDRIRCRVGNARFVRRQILNNFVTAEQKDLVLRIVPTGCAPLGSIRSFVRHLFDPALFLGTESILKKAVGRMVDSVLIILAAQRIEVGANIALFPRDVFIPIVVLVLLKDVLTKHKDGTVLDVKHLPRERRRRIAILILRIAAKFDEITHGKGARRNALVVHTEVGRITNTRIGRGIIRLIRAGTRNFFHTDFADGHKTVLTDARPRSARPVSVSIADAQIVRRVKSLFWLVTRFFAASHALAADLDITRRARATARRAGPVRFVAAPAYVRGDIINLFRRVTRAFDALHATTADGHEVIGAAACTGIANPTEFRIAKTDVHRRIKDLFEPCTRTFKAPDAPTVDFDIAFHTTAHPSIPRPVALGIAHTHVVFLVKSLFRRVTRIFAAPHASLHDLHITFRTRATADIPRPMRLGMACARVRGFVIDLFCRVTRAFDALHALITDFHIIGLTSTRITLGKIVLVLATDGLWNTCEIIFIGNFTFGTRIRLTSIMATNIDV